MALYKFLASWTLVTRRFHARLTSYWCV